MGTWIALLAGLAYGTGWLLTARALFWKWRPYRVAACTKKSHYPGRHDPVQGRVTPQLGLGHGRRCYQRRRPDLSLIDISTDREAVRKALSCALAWPAVVAALLVMRNPPELELELKARLAARDRLIARDQARLDRDLTRELEGNG